jgi:DNA ligase-1
MQRFAALLDRLILTPQRNAKLRLLKDYFQTTGDPDRGYALAALTGELNIPSVKPAMLRGIVGERIDEVLFAYSYDYVGDLAETIALVWPESVVPTARPSLPRWSSGCCRLREAKGHGWSKAGSTRSTRPGAGR